MIHVYDRNRRLQAICGNAFDISEELKINSLNHLSFSLPKESPDNRYCQPYNLVRYETRGYTSDFYRIIPRVTERQEFSSITYQCEHVFALLNDDILDPMREHIVGGIGFNTANAIGYVLGFQEVRNWSLQATDFVGFFEYGWEKESVLSALATIPKPITEPWMWAFDTSAYPFRLSLKRIDKEKSAPDFWIQGGKNLVRVTDAESNLHIATRVYPFGYGEGTNQLTIEAVNDGMPFIQSPPDVVARYGLISKVLIDRRYKLPDELLDYARQMLALLQEPHNEFEVDFSMDIALADPQVKGADFARTGRPRLGDVVEIRDENNQPIERNIITGVRFKYGEVDECSINIANRPRDIAGALADMIDRQRIETSYAQGATQFFTDHVHENGSPQYPVVLRVFIPDSMVWINSVNIDVQLSGFRAPFDVTQGGGGATSGPSSEATTKDGGGIHQSTSGGGGRLYSTEDGGAITSAESRVSSTSYPVGIPQQTNLASDEIELLPQGVRVVSDGGVGDANHNHGISRGTRFATVADHNSTTVNGSVAWVPSGAHRHIGHSHTYHVPAHSHTITIPGHSHEISAHRHNFSMPDHNHQIEVPPHYHGMAHNHTIPDHHHALVPNIRHIGNPNSFIIRINGVDLLPVNGTALPQNRRDITRHLVDPALRAIRRNRFHTIEIIPNIHAYVQLTLNMQFFIQSKGVHKL